MGKNKTPEHLRPFVKSKSGPMFVSLNALRAVSIIALVLVLVSNVVTIMHDSKAIKAARKPASENTTSEAASTPAPTTSVPASTRVVVVTAAPTPTPSPRIVTVAARDDNWYPTYDSYGTSETSDSYDTYDSSYDAPAPAPSRQCKPRAPVDTTDLYEWVTIDDDGTVTPVDAPGDGTPYETQEWSADQNAWTPTEDENQDGSQGETLDATAVPSVQALAAQGNAAGTNVTVNDYCNYLKDSTVPLQTAGAFWSILNRIFIILEAILLIMAEVGYPKVLFRDYIPMLGGAYGLGTLGVLQALIASSVLSHHSSLFPQVSAWLLFVVACFNCAAGIFLRDKAKKTRALFKWEKPASDDALPTTQGRTVAYDWSADYQEKLAASKAQAHHAQFGAGSAASSVYSTPSTLTSHTHVKEPMVIPGARFGGLAFGKQAELEREGNPKISRPIDMVRSG